MIFFSGTKQEFEDQYKIKIQIYETENNDKGFYLPTTIWPHEYEYLEEYVDEGIIGLIHHRLRDENGHIRYGLPVCRKNEK